MCLEWELKIKPKAWCDEDGGCSIDCLGLDSLQTKAYEVGSEAGSVEDSLVV